MDGCRAISASRAGARRGGTAPAVRNTQHGQDAHPLGQVEQEAEALLVHEVGVVDRDEQRTLARSSRRTGCRSRRWRRSARGRRRRRAGADAGSPTRTAEGPLQRENRSRDAGRPRGARTGRSPHRGRRPPTASPISRARSRPRRELSTRRRPARARCSGTPASMPRLARPEQDVPPWHRLASPGTSQGPYQATLPHSEIRADPSLAQLTLRRWRISLAVERVVETPAHAAAVHVGDEVHERMQGEHVGGHALLVGLLAQARSTSRRRALPRARGSPSADGGRSGTRQAGRSEPRSRR